MTATIDAKKRITLGLANPGERFDVQATGDGVFLLRRLEPVKKDVVINPVKRKDGSYRWPVKLDRKEISAAIRADRDSQ